MPFLGPFERSAPVAITRVYIRALCQKQLYGVQATGLGGQMEWSSVAFRQRVDFRPLFKQQRHKVGAAVDCCQVKRRLAGIVRQV